ncbi:MAG: alanine--glyoxylate aminotransferase family protein [Flavobacteriales bacterium]|nr:alanine--glyoxylate aminotransferase family protein [Flavobacteriales bacterium]
MKGRELLMIPGPIESDPAVLSALGQQTSSFVAPEFIAIMGDCLRMMREVWLSPDGQPFIIAGSGTLAMDMAVVNLVEPGDEALVISTGYFGDRYEDLLSRYGVKVTKLEAPVGDVPDPADVEALLRQKRFKLMTFTHVDTSTAVRVDPIPLGALGRKYGVLTVLDGVCSIAGEEMRQDEWEIDVALTASQKAIGVPAGLALLVASKHALEVWKDRKTPVSNYYADWKNWLPVMEAYEAGKPAYFGTPATNLVAALQVSLIEILQEGMATRFARHAAISEAFKNGMSAIGLGQVPLNPQTAAHTLSAIRYPEGVTGAAFLPAVRKAGAIIAGGLHSRIKDEYFRVGHMGTANRGDLLTTVGAIEEGLAACGYAFEKGAGVAAVSGQMALDGV